MSAIVESDVGTRLLIDTPPELRLQLIAAGVDRIDAVLFTHDHADHTHGIDDLRAITIHRGAALPMYASPETLARLAAKFGYIFDDTMRPVPGTSKPEGTAHPIADGLAFRVAEVEILPVRVPHGPFAVMAFRIGGLAYVTDAKEIPPRAIDCFRGVRVLVLNALFRTEHPTHLSIPEAIEVARAVGAERTFLTHLSHENRHADLEAELPPGMAPAFDGLTVRVD